MIRETTSKDSLFRCLNGVKMWNTVLRMTSPQCFNDGVAIYNPEIVFRLLLNILKTEKVSCNRFINENGLAFAFAATSFESPDLRMYGYTVLQRFHGLLKNEQDFPQKPLYLFLITLFKHSVTVANKRICHVISQFFARVTKMMLNPLDHVYPAIMSFLALKPVMDLNNVPEFMKLFFSSSTQHFAEERVWMLRLCAWSVIEPQDYQVISASFVVESCQAAYVASFADEDTKLEIIRLFINCLRLKSAAHEFILRFNFLSWLAFAVEYPSTTQVEELMLTDVFLICIHQLRKIYVDIDASGHNDNRAIAARANDKKRSKRDRQLDGVGESKQSDVGDDLCPTMIVIKNALIKMNARRIVNRLKKVDDDVERAWRIEVLEKIVLPSWNFVSPDCDVGDSSLVEKLSSLSHLSQQSKPKRIRRRRNK